jgi:hypothetical protein
MKLGPASAEERRARWLLVPLLVVLLGMAAVAPWHTATSVDNRSYIEMIEGIREHGVPYMHNGPASEFAELRARFNILREDNKLWGVYPPVFPYLAAPFLALGGVKAISQLNFFLLAILALCIYGLGRVTSRDPYVGTIAAYLAILASPALVSSYQTLAQPTFLITLTVASYFAVRSLASSGRAALGYAAGCGLFAGLALATHLIGATMGWSLFALLALAPGFVPASEWAKMEGGASILARLRGWAPKRDGLARAGVAALVWLVTILPVSVLNHARFGTWNPVSYGPCVWRSCVQYGPESLHVSSIVIFVAPVVAWTVATLAGLWFTRRSWWKVLLVVLAAAAPMVLSAVLRDRASLLATTAFGYVVDVSVLYFDPPYLNFHYHLGHALGPYVVKSTFQSSPILLLAVLAYRVCKGGKAAALALILPVLALVVTLTLLAITGPAVFRMGYPYMFLRYIVPGVPFLAILAAITLRELSFRGRHVAIGAAVAVGLGAWFLSDTSDHPLPRRIVLLVVSLTLAIACTVIVGLARAERRARWRGAARWVAGVTAGFSFAVGVAVDARGMLDLQTDYDAQQDRFAALTPARFAMMGWPLEMDHILPLRASRDIQYADLWESENWGRAREIIDVWEREGRPIYGLFKRGERAQSPWPDVKFEIIDEESNFVRISTIGRATQARQTAPNASELTAVPWP